jgi:thymidylate synthase (FAD)
MKLIEPKAELLLQPEGLEGVYKQIELCGRTCYKSTDKITDESAKPFVERMIASKHTAMLEQGTVYLYFSYKENEEEWIKYTRNPYSKVISKYNHTEGNPHNEFYFFDRYVTTNYRVLVENNWLDDLKYLCSPTEFHEKRYTIKFNADIHFYKDATRHRSLSYAIESTRFCNYLKEKFGMSVSFMCPSWLTEQFRDEFEEDCKTIEQIYFKWINKGLRAEQAAYFLCQGTAAEVCITGFASDWRFFFDLRYYGETGKPHPDMELLASKARDEFIKAGLWEDIMSYPSKYHHDKD